jgi:signal transduction histidine kinase
MASQADNEGRPMAGEMSYFAHEQLKEAVALVQAAIDNDFDAMTNAFTEVTEVDHNLRKDESILLHDKLQEALSALCPDNPSVARIVFLTSVKMIEDAKSGGLRLSAYP